MVHWGHTNITRMQILTSPTTDGSATEDVDPGEGVNTIISMGRKMSSLSSLSLPPYLPSLPPSLHPSIHPSLPPSLPLSLPPPPPSLPPSLSLSLSLFRSLFLSLSLSFSISLSLSLFLSLSLSLCLARRFDGSSYGSHESASAYDSSDRGRYVMYYEYPDQMSDHL